MNILVTGGTGFVGRALIQRLSGMSDYQVIAALRTMSAGLPVGVNAVVIGDLSSDPDWRGVLSKVETIIHAVARVHVMKDISNDPLTEYRKVNVEGTLNLVRCAAESGVKRFVFISSIKVNGEGTVPGEPYTADDVPNPVDPYGISKCEAEAELSRLAAETGMEVVIIRPVLIYGPGVKANFRSMMHWINKGIPLPFGAIYNKRSLVALDNLVDLIVLCIGHPAAANQVFLVSDGEDLSTTELLARMGRALDRPACLLPVPAKLLEWGMTIFGMRAIAQRLCGSLQVDISKTRRLLGWSPSISVDQGLQKTAEDFLKNNQT